jgi:hypothetical protein
VATIGQDHFAIETEFTYGDYYFVTSAANGKNKWLLFHYYNIGTTIGLIDHNFIFRIRKFYSADSLEFPWEYAVVDGRGYLMLVGLLPAHSPKLTVGFGQVLDDGTYVEWWRTELPGLPFSFGYPLIGLKSAHAWFTDERGKGANTVYIFDIKHAQILSSRQWTAPIRGMVADGDIIYLSFDDHLRTTEICVLNSRMELVTVKRTEFDFHDYITTVGFQNQIASTPGAHLLYAAQSFDAGGEIRVLSRDGFKLTKQLSNMSWLWHYSVRC